MCTERGVAMQTIKSIALAPWDGRPQTASTWYEPLTDPADIDVAVRWVLARPEMFLNTVGDVNLLPHVLAAAERFDGKQPSADEVEALVERRSLTPLFVLDSVAIDIDGSLVERYLLDLARHGAHGETGVWRVAYSPEWVAAQEQIALWLAEAGLEVRRDAVGNVWGRLAGVDERPVIATGSHIDSQTPGGRYDGALGVVGALVALRTLRERFGRPRRTIEAVSLCEEEASRFHAANFWGSRAIAGTIESDEAERVVDFEGVSIGEAMRAVGLDPRRIPEAARDDIETWIELHIEQGPILETAGLPVGVVDAITGIRHYVVEPPAGPIMPARGRWWAGSIRWRASPRS